MHWKRPRCARHERVRPGMQDVHAAQREAWRLGLVEERHGPMHERPGRRVSACAGSSLSALCELARL